ncbi:MAG: hypothetical protein H0V95_11895 [Actinobacteria bacterium]|nr:hypothetical protein [Actinomycetota bacterium]
MPAVDFIELSIEESPVYDGAPAAAPYRVSTDKLYLPARSGVIRPSPQHLDRSDELRGLLSAPARLIETYQPSGALSVRAYARILTWLLHLSGFTGVRTAGGTTVPDGNATQTTAIVAAAAATVPVVDTSQFPSTGSLVSGGTAFTYTGKTATSFTGCTSTPGMASGATVNGVAPTGTSKWVFDKRDAIDAKTAQIRINYATEQLLSLGNGYAVSQLTLNALGEVAAELMGLVFKRQAVDTTTVPAMVAQSIPPFRRRELYLRWLTGGGRVADFNLTIANAVERVNSLGVASPTPYPDALEHGDEQVQVTGSIPKRILDADDVDALLSAATFAALAYWRSTATIAVTGYPYSVWVDLPACQYVDGAPGEMGNKRRYGMDSLDFFAAHSETAGYDARVVLVNDVAAIETFV